MFLSLIVCVVYLLCAGLGRVGRCGGDAGAGGVVGDVVVAVV